MNTNTKVVIFDADGMIVHGDRFSKRLEQQFGISTEVTGPFFKNEFQLCLIGKADLREELARRIEGWGWKKSVDDLLDFWFGEEYTTIDSRFKPLIAKLKGNGIAVYLATNNEKYRTENLVVKRGLGTWVDGVFSSAHLGSKKPEPVFFQLIIDDIGVDKTHVLFWDDDIENVEGARAFGIPTELFTDFSQFQQKIAHLIQ
ncbi:MAG: HAD-IA family hydrolase [Patescibacteria group bacterium]|nr:HAD-IA family hydrolase [Patescibacteria group bacterium]